jgi:hypothetical protein
MPVRVPYPLQKGAAHGPTIRLHSSKMALGEPTSVPKRVGTAYAKAPRPGAEKACVFGPSPAHP